MPPNPRDSKPFSSQKPIPIAQGCLEKNGQTSSISETLEQLTFGNGEGESTFCPEDFPVNPLAVQGSDKAKMMTETSGRQCGQLSQMSNRFGLFVKTCLESSAWGNSKQFVWIWKTSVTKSNRLLFQLTQLEHTTCENGYSLLPTPHANCHTGAGTQGRDGGMNLQTAAAKLWPTPNAGNFNDGESIETWEARREKNKAKGINGNGQGTPLAIAAKLWPTPTVPNGGRRNPAGTSITGKKPDGEKAQMDLREFAIRMLPTPQAHDAAKGDPARVNRFGTEHGGRNLNDEMGGSLSPEFVEWLMMFPIGWTQLQCPNPSAPKKKKSQTERRDLKR